MPLVSFTTVVRRAQTLGGLTKSSQDGDEFILVAEFPDKATAEDMRYYALDKGWHVPDEVAKDKDSFYVTIFAPPGVDYRNLLKKYMLAVDVTDPDEFTDEEWEVIQEIGQEIIKENPLPKRKGKKKGALRRSKKTR